jgi:hypothetical protein
LTFKFTHHLLQVLKPQLAAVKGHVAALRAGAAALKAAPSSSGSGSGSGSGSSGLPASSSRAAKAKRPKPAYLELLVNLQQVVFCLEQSPLETWMGLHGPLLQAMAAERHLTEQLLASCATAHGRISRSGGSAAAAAARAAMAASTGTAPGRRSQRFSSSKRAGQLVQQQSQRQRWGGLSKMGAGAVLSGIASGSVTEAVAAATAMATAGPLTAGLHARSAAATAAAGLPSTAAAAGEQAGSGAASAGAAAAGPGHDAAAAGGSDAEPGDSSAESSDELDTSEDDMVGLADPDALAAALPSSASELAAAAAGIRQGPTPEPEAAVAAAGAAGGAVGLEQTLPAAAAAAGASSGSSNEMAQAVLEAHRELFAMYRYRCRPLAAAAEDAYHHSRAVMHLNCLRAEAVVLICLPGNPAADAMATEVGGCLEDVEFGALVHQSGVLLTEGRGSPCETCAVEPGPRSRVPCLLCPRTPCAQVIRRVDPPSEGIEMSRTQSISLDVGAHDVAVHFGGVEEVCAVLCRAVLWWRHEQRFHPAPRLPALNLLLRRVQMACTIGSIGASGLLVRARQVCAPPQTRPMRMAVGRWHAADVPVVVKGTRPPMKVRGSMEGHTWNDYCLAWQHACSVHLTSPASATPHHTDVHRPPRGAG